MSQIKIKRMGCERLPTYATSGSAAMDIYCCEEATLKPGDKVLIPTGFAIQMPINLACQIIPRSSLGTKHGITLSNTVGLIDSDYRGEILVPLQNTGKSTYTLKKGDRIAQMMFVRISNVYLDEVAELDDTERGSGGLGSTGN